MRPFVSILFCLLLFNCKAQDSEFNTYLRNFGQPNFPIVVNNTQSCNIIFNQRYDSLFGKTYKEIQENLVGKFICTGGFCNSNGGYFRYDYGVKLYTSQDFTTVLVRKQKYEGNDEFEFDLTEFLILSYNNKGEILSRQYISKDNDRWKSSVKISVDSISVQQIKITEPEMNKNTGLRCEFWTTTYQITKEGIIKPINTSPVSTGVVIWDKSNEDYKLKE